MINARRKAGMIRIRKFMSKRWRAVLVTVTVCLVIALFLSRRSVRLEGSVIDASGTPVAGVNIRAKVVSTPGFYFPIGADPHGPRGTEVDMGATTDASGHFTLSATSGDVVYVTNIGRLGMRLQYGFSGKRAYSGGEIHGHWIFGNIMGLASHPIEIKMTAIPPSVQYLTKPTPHYR